MKAFFFVFSAVLVLRANAQCKQFDLGGGTLGIDVCYGQATALSVKYVCNNGAVDQQTFATSDCSGTPQTAPVAGTANVVCMGQKCSITIEDYSDGTCSGTPTTTEQFADATCNYGSTYECANNAVVIYNFGGTDQTCTGNATSQQSIIRYGVGVCQPYESWDSQTQTYSIRSRKVPACSLAPASARVSGMGVQYTTYYGDQTCNGQFASQYETALDSMCQPSISQWSNTSSKFYCGNNAYWTFSYDKDITCTTLTSVSFFPTGCTAVGSFFSSGSLVANLTNGGVSCLSGATAPPPFSFSTQSGLIEYYVDAACTQRVYGAYLPIDNMCSGGLPSTMTSCAADGSGGVQIDFYFSSTNCSGTATNSTVFAGGACEPIPFSTGSSSTPFNYIKVTECGKVAPGTSISPTSIPGLSGVRAREVGVVALVLVVVLSAFSV